MDIIGTAILIVLAGVAVWLWRSFRSMAENYILTDAATGVQYQVYADWRGVAITPRLDADGRVMVRRDE